MIVLMCVLVSVIVQAIPLSLLKMKCNEGMLLYCKSYVEVYALALFNLLPSV